MNFREFIRLTEDDTAVVAHQPIAISSNATAMPNQKKMLDDAIAELDPHRYVMSGTLSYMPPETAQHWANTPDKMVEKGFNRPIRYDREESDIISQDARLYEKNKFIGPSLAKLATSFKRVLAAYDHFNRAYLIAGHFNVESTDRLRRFVGSDYDKYLHGWRNEQRAKGMFDRHVSSANRGMNSSRQYRIMKERFSFIKDKIDSFLAIVRRIDDRGFDPSVRQSFDMFKNEVSRFDKIYQSEFPKIEYEVDMFAERDRPQYTSSTIGHIPLGQRQDDIPDS